MGTARCDFPNGSAATLWESVQRILGLPDDTRTFAGHDYPGTDRPLIYESTVEEQKRTNKHVGGQATREAFIETRRARDATLAAPGLLLVSLQCNIEAGELPKAEDNGYGYLRIPVDFPIGSLAHP